MTERELRADLFGRRVEFQYSEKAIAYAIVLLRVVMGWVLFQAGIEKLFAPEGWTAAGYLNNAIPEGNPLMGFWGAMAGNSLIDALNVWGQVLTGFGLVIGALVRWNAFWAAIMMIFYWLASLQGGLLQGLPLEHGWVVDDHLVYAVLLFGLGAIGAGRILGVDAWLEETEFVRQNRWAEYLLG